MQIRELRLHAADPVELIAFYTETLGLPIVEHSESRVSFDAGTTRLSFARASSGQKPYYHMAFNIPENKIAESVRWATGRLELIHQTGTNRPIVDFPNINAHSVYFFDPGGNLLEFIARHDLDNGETGGFDTKEILNVSEIGLVVDDVPETVKALGEQLGIPVYPEGRKPSETFSMLGAATGALIVVRRNRIWFMTDDLPGKVFPTEILVEGPRPGEAKLGDFPYIVSTG